MMAAGSVAMSAPVRPVEAVTAAKWYVLAVTGGRERIVKRKLSGDEDEPGLSIESFLPLEETQAFRPARPATTRRPALPELPQVCRPMFPGYVFVLLDIAAVDWQALREIRGALRLLADEEGRPIPVRGAQLAKLQRRCDKDGVVVLPDPDEKPKPEKRQFAEGDLIRIVAGPFAGYSGVFLRRRHEKAQVLIGTWRNDVLLDQIAEVG